jgi:hypothetical protein
MGRGNRLVRRRSTPRTGAHEGTTKSRSCTPKSASAIAPHAEHATSRAGPKAFGGSPASFYVYVEDADTLFNRAIASGGRVHGNMGALADQFWGDRSGTLLDPFGYQWTIATRKEDLTPQEMEQRRAA